MLSSLQVMLGWRSKAKRMGRKVQYTVDLVLLEISKGPVYLHNKSRLTDERDHYLPAMSNPLVTSHNERGDNDP